MAYLQKIELPPLQTPLNYPECLDRIVDVAVNTAQYEIDSSRLFSQIMEYAIYNPDYSFIDRGMFNANS